MACEELDKESYTSVCVCVRCSDSRAGKGGGGGGGSDTELLRSFCLTFRSSGSFAASHLWERSKVNSWFYVKQTSSS